jgi:type VI secretion system protein ImpJ
MKQLTRIVWQEGMYLGPHHFQTQARFFEDSLQFGLASIYSDRFRFGLLQCSWNEDAIADGTLQVDAIAGILPDGLPFEVPAADSRPEQIKVDLGARDSVEIHLTIAPHDRRGGNYSPAPARKGDTQRYTVSPRKIPDDFAGGEEKEVLVGQRNLRLITDADLTVEEPVSIPVARVVRARTGEPAFDPQFIPPVLRISASRTLLQMATSLLDVLEEKAAALRPSVAGRKRGGDISNRQLTQFWFLHTINRAQAALRHLIEKNCHPEELYLELTRLAAELCTFVMESSPAALPAYDHRRPGPAFRTLNDHIREHLNLVFPENCIRIALSAAGSYFDGELTDPRVLGPSRWIFGVRSEAGESRVITGTPRLVKICSSEFVRKLVSRQLPGLPLNHLQYPPAECDPRPDVQYFTIACEGPCWTHMTKTRQVGIYVPPEDLPNPELELLVVLPERT